MKRIKKIVVCTNCAGTSKVKRSRWPHEGDEELDCAACNGTGRKLRIVQIEDIALTEDEFKKLG